MECYYCNKTTERDHSFCNNCDYYKKNSKIQCEECSYKHHFNGSNWDPYVLCFKCVKEIYKTMKTQNNLKK